MDGSAATNTQMIDLASKANVIRLMLEWRVRTKGMVLEMFAWMQRSL